MQFRAVTRDTADAAFVVGRNRAAGTITQNLVACWDTSTSQDGVYVQQAAATDIQNMAGVADENIASNAYGRIQNWGYRASALFSHVGSSITITKGDPLGPVSGTWGLFSFAPHLVGAIAMETTTAISATGYLKVFLRCI